MESLHDCRGGDAEVEVPGLNGVCVSVHGCSDTGRKGAAVRNWLAL